MIREGERVLVLGAGRSGAAAAALLLRAGARVAVYDRDAAALEALALDVERITGPELPAGAFDHRVASPGIPLPAGYEAMAEVDLAASRLTAPLVGVTGTNGKSTTTVLIAEMLEAAGLRCAVGGNLGTPLSALVETPADVVVAELSSFQLEHASRLHARVAVLLNLAPDHLDRHASLEAYGSAKARLARLQRPDDVLIANLDDAWACAVAAGAAAQVRGFSAAGDPDAELRVAGSELLGPGLRLPLERVSAAARPLDNALAAAGAALAAGADAGAVARVLEHFEGLPHRGREVASGGGVRWVNDSKATNPAAALASVRAQPGAPIWIAGGRNKGLDLAPLRGAAARARHTLLYGEARDELAAALAGLARVETCADLAGAVRAAAALARPGDTVLLAPACASFDAYRSFAERGEHFTVLARRAAAGDATC